MQAQGRHVSRRVESVGDVARPADDSLRGDPVHLGKLGRLQRGAVAQPREGLVGRAVGYHNDKLGAGHS